MIQFVISIFFASCASRITPSGGPRDTKPPEVIRSNPSNLSSGFSGNKIIFEFSEFVQLKDGGRGILFSPPLRALPEINLSGKNLTIQLKESLQSNTTYNVLLGKSIVDLTEGNELKEYSLVFSTGIAIDSLKLMGRITDAESGKPIKDVLVMLYPQLEDSMPRKSNPQYISRSDNSGLYELKNITKGTYMIFALNDQNGNYKYDLPEEKIGFHKDLISIDSGSKNEMDFRIFLNPSKFRLIKKEYSPSGKLDLKYSRPLEKLSIKTTPAKENMPVLFSTFMQGNDSLSLWMSKAEMDSSMFIAEATSNGEIIKDTIPMLPKKKSPRTKGKVANDSSISISPLLFSGKVPPGDSLTIVSSSPLTKVDPRKIFFMMGKDTLKMNLPEIDQQKPVLEYQIGLRNFEQEKYRCIALPGAFQDIYGIKSDTLTFNFSLMDTEEKSTLDFMINSEKQYPDLILVLVDKSGRMIQKEKYVGGESFFFSALLPGEYSIQLFEDLNKNGKWDSGNFEKKEFPEKIYHYPEKITIRPGWDLELSWDFSE